MKNIARLGQVFTPQPLVDLMVGLRRRGGSVLEPSCGNGAFLSSLPRHTIAVEFDARFCPPQAICCDFFDFQPEQRFDTIIGNPPYVRHQDIIPETRAKLDHRLFDCRSNLYLFFIERCLRMLADGGELIFITPRDFLKSTSSRRLNELLYQQGTITDFIDLGDGRFFDGASPNCAIWRFEKGCFSKETSTVQGLRQFVCRKGQISFLEHRSLAAKETFLGDYCFVKVGGVSGADDVFASEVHGTDEFVCSKTVSTGQTRSMIYNRCLPVLEPHRDRLLARRIRSFDETNWWEWGRGYYESEAPRLYVNAKTRNPRPFFCHPATAYDGSVLAIFPSDPDRSLLDLADALNGLPWGELGFVCDGRFLFSQRALEGALLPAPL